MLLPQLVVEPVAGPEEHPLGKPPQQAVLPVARQTGHGRKAQPAGGIGAVGKPTVPNRNPFGGEQYKWLVVKLGRSTRIEST